MVHTVSYQTVARLIIMDGGWCILHMCIPSPLLKFFTVTVITIQPLATMGCITMITYSENRFNI